MPSFDIVSEVDQVELRNAVDQTNKEVSTRFDFKGSDARVETAEGTLTLYADDDFKLAQVTDILTAKIVVTFPYGDAVRNGNTTQNITATLDALNVSLKQDLAGGNPNNPAA